MLQLLLLLLPLAAFLGGLAVWRYLKSKEQSTRSSFVSPGYFQGLNYLINEQPDKAVDVFIKMLEVNTDTVETHLALGNLFRRRGEVDRAIRVHQNLIARPQLVEKQRKQALFELAQDYLKAGVMDRAEKLFLELIKLGGDIPASLQSLIHIYQQQKDWRQAIATAKRLENISDIKMNHAIAHYYCELADQLRKADDSKEAEGYLKEALHYDKKCVRANILLGEILFNTEQYKQAIKVLQKVYDQDDEFVSEVINILGKSYQKIGKEEEFKEYLTKRIEESPRNYYIMQMVKYLSEKEGDKVAFEFISKQLPRSLSLRGLAKMLDLYISYIDTEVYDQLVLLKDFIDKLLANKPVYRCISCGFSCKNLYWQCPSCRRWNSVKPIHGLEGD